MAFLIARETQGPDPAYQPAVFPRPRPARLLFMPRPEHGKPRTRKANPPGLARAMAVVPGGISSQARLPAGMGNVGLVAVQASKRAMEKSIRSAPETRGYAIEGSR